MFISEYPIIATAGQMPPAALLARQAANAASARRAPQSIRAHFGPKPDLKGAECYVYRDGPYDFTLLLINGDGGAQLLSQTRLETCMAAASWLAARGAAVVVWQGNYWDMPAASRGCSQ